MKYIMMLVVACMLLTAVTAGCDHDRRHHQTGAMQVR
jgi:hypothetical protein